MVAKNEKTKEQIRKKDEKRNMALQSALQERHKMVAEKTVVHYNK
jgi:hypothetical protein